MTQHLVSVGAFIVEWWIVFLYFNNIFENKRPKHTTALAGLGLYAVPTIVFILFGIPVVNTLLLIVINCIYAFCFYKASLIKSIVASATYIALMMASEFIVMILLSLITNGDINQYISSEPVYALSTTISKTLLLFLSIFVARFLFSRKSASTDKTPAFLFIFPLSAIFIDLSFWRIASTIELESETKIIISAGSVVLLISVLFTYVFYGNAMRKNSELFQLQSAFERSETERKYYSILDKQNEELRSFIHDEKNHLTAIKVMSDDPEIHNYIDSIIGDLNRSTPLGNTKNKTLDLIIGKYNYLCNIKQINFTYSTPTANLLFINDSDLVSMMSNILDNAVEASENADDKWIDMYIERVGGVTLFTCDNSCATAPIILNGTLKSSKENKKLHGIGMKSIARTCEKYNAQLEWNYNEDNKVFSVNILFRE
ncbi:MAG: GHKL domain-containing protein [Clostridia bacterium]|nr:GHKL domain-containing protein [Clostridia bacterium]